MFEILWHNLLQPFIIYKTDFFSKHLISISIISQFAMPASIETAGWEQVRVHDYLDDFSISILAYLRLSINSAPAGSF
jgi:hypothetical protein